jgi:thymidine phosphorylase
MEVTLALGAEMLMLAGKAVNRAEAVARLKATIRSGAALDKLREVVRWQGGDVAVIDDPSRLPAAPIVRKIRAGHNGRMPPLPPRALGEMVVAMGGGRRTAADEVDPAVGLEILPRVGQSVQGGEVVAVVHARTAADADVAETSLLRALDAAWQRHEQPLPLLLERITSEHSEPYGELQWDR